MVGLGVADGVDTDGEFDGDQGDCGAVSHGSRASVPAAVDDAIAVYKEMLKTYKPKNIGIYGTSAGAILTAEVTAKIKQLGLPMPGATGVFSGTGDFEPRG